MFTKHKLIINEQCPRTIRPFVYRQRLGLCRLVGEDVSKRLMRLVVGNDALCSMRRSLKRCCAVLIFWFFLVGGSALSCWLCRRHKERWMSRLIFGSVCLMQKQSVGWEPIPAYLERRDPLSLMWQYLILINTSWSELKVNVKINFYQTRVNSDMTKLNSVTSKVIPTGSR